MMVPIRYTAELKEALMSAPKAQLLVDWVVNYGFACMMGEIVERECQEVAQ